MRPTKLIINWFRAFWNSSAPVALDIVGYGIVAFGIGMVFLPAGVIAAGLSLILFGKAVSS